MAGLYHKIDLTLNKNKKVLRAAKMLKVDVDLVVGKLVRMWTFAHQQGLRFGDVSVYVLPEFAPEFFGFLKGSDKKREALASKWLRVFLDCGTSLDQGLLVNGENGAILINGWEEYMAQDEARKSNNNRRQQLSRERKKQAAEQPCHTLRHSDVTGLSSSSSKAEQSNSNTTQREGVTDNAEKQEPEQPPKDRTLDWMEVILSEWESVTGVNPGGCGERATHQTGPAWHEFHTKHGEPALRQVVQFYHETKDPKYITFESFVGKVGLSIAPQALKVQGWLDGGETSETEAKTEKSPPTPVSADCVRIWGEVVAALRRAPAISEEDSNTWFASVRMSLIDDLNYTLQVPSHYRRDVIKETYEETIKQAIRDSANMCPDEEINLKYQITGQAGEGKKEC